MNQLSAQLGTVKFGLVNGLLIDFDNPDTLPATAVMAEAGLDF